MPAATDCDGAGGQAAGTHRLLTPPCSRHGGLLIGWERVPQRRGFLLNAAALENGVEHRAGELAGRSVGEMVGDRPGAWGWGVLSCGCAG